MVKVLPPYKPDIGPTPPGTRASVAPSPHVLFIEEVGYYDGMGRNPFQMFQIWSIKDDEERARKTEEILLSEWPGSRPRQRMLSDAARRGDAAIVQCLIKNGVKICPDTPGRNGIPAETKSDSDDEEEESESDDKDDPDETPFHSAAIRGHLECVKIMYESGMPNIDVQDSYGRTALLMAAEGGKIDVVRYLLENGADPTIRTDAKNKDTGEPLGDYGCADALEYAADARPLSIELLKLLVEHPVHGSTRRRKPHNAKEPGVYVTPLAIRGACKNNVEALRYLLDQGHYPLEGKDGKSKGELLDDTQRKTIQDLIPDILETADYDSLMLILSYLHPTNDDGQVLQFEISESLLRPFTWATYNAISTNDIRKFNWMYAFGIHEHSTMSLDSFPETQHINIQQLVDRAAQSGAVEGLTHIITQHGGHPDKTRLPSGIRPIFTAAMHDQPSIISYLLTNHAIDIHFGNGTFATGPTALHSAICTKSLLSIAHLLLAGGPVDTIDDEILHLKHPITAILSTSYERRHPVLLRTESNAAAYIADCRADWMTCNPAYVRLELDPEQDKAWIERLVPRKSDAELAEHGDMARRLDREDTSREDPCEYLVEFPVSAERESMLRGDADLIPEWRPLFG